MNAVKIQPGDYVEVDMDNGHVILKPRKLIDPSQGWYWTKEWQEIENRIDQELKEKEHSLTFQTAEEGAIWLDE